MLGLLLGVGSILWQVHVYRESHTEKVIARVSIHHIYKPDEDEEAMTHKGGVSVEVTNIGQQALYLRKVSIEPCYPAVGRLAVFYDGSSAVADAVRLEPGAPRTFSIKTWDYDDIPFLPEKRMVSNSQRQSNASSGDREYKSKPFVD